VVGYDRVSEGSVYGGGERCHNLFWLSCEEIFKEDFGNKVNLSRFISNNIQTIILKRISQKIWITKQLDETIIG